MSRISDLATILDEMTRIGNQLMTCGRELMTASARLRDSLAGDAPESPSEPPAAEEPEETRPKTGRKRKPEPPAEPVPDENVTARTDPGVTDEPARLPTKEEMRAMLADLAQNGHRDEAIDIVRRYSGGKSFSDIDTEYYPMIQAEVEQYA